MEDIKDALASQQTGAEKGRMEWGVRMEWTTVMGEPAG